MVGFGVGPTEAPCNDDSFACYPFQALIEKAPDTGISPIMLQLLTPAPLIFAELLLTVFYLFRKISGQALILAGPSVLLSALLACLFVKYLHPQYFDWNTGVIVAAMIAASDLVAVLAGMKVLGADPSLFMIISLKIRIDGCAVVLFIHFCTAAFNYELVETGGIVLFTIVNMFGTGAFGLLYFFVAAMILKLCRQEMPVVVSICITVPFFCY